ncbi:hypothetical protein [Paenibacillus segetis]|uniref:Glycosyl hydrolase family 32 n=1 Tax=Paenibacillus segetis TaxID=1325360 RepID=A0ABQ1YYD1_9BACL|nr:hypothetical protein [Paenibacillus segetis]GGH40724.1 hypothetical protein GCM10008013_50350 [Paenibacillus segetis]
MSLKKSSMISLILILLMVPLFPTQRVHAQTKLYTEQLLKVTDRVSNSKQGDIAYNGQFYLFFDYGGNLYKSFDGLKWEAQEPYSMIDGVQYDGANGLVRKLIFDGGQFVVLYNLGFATSQDGKIWERHVIPYTAKKEYEFQDLLFVNGTYYFLAQERDKNVNGLYFPGPNHILISSDLKSFQKAQFKNLEESLAGERPLDSLVTNGKIFLATGNTSAVSKDGKLWTGKNANFLGGYNGIWDGNRFLYAYQNSIFSTLDGSDTKELFSFKSANWNPKTKQYSVDGLQLYLNVIGFNGKEYLAAGNHYDWAIKERAQKETILIYSADGKKWEKITIPQGGTDFTGIVPTSFGFLLIGNNLWAVSTQPLVKSAE